MTEAQLIQACINNDRKAQKALYDRYSGVMYAICIRYTHHRENALDVLQEGFIKVFSQLASFKGEGSFEGWMKRIFIHTAITHYHKIKTLADHFSLMDELPETWSDQVTVINKMSEKELLRMVASLPDGYRLVFNLYVIEGYDHAEVGKLLNISPGTSRSQLLKARRMLQQKLKEMKIIAA